MLSSEKRGTRQVIIQYFHMSSFHVDLKLYELKGQGLIGVKRAPAKYHQQQANYSPVSTPKERVISAQSHCQQGVLASLYLNYQIYFLALSREYLSY